MSSASTCHSLDSSHFGIVAKSDLYHSHPPLQRTESLNRSFFNSSLQTAHDLIHSTLFLDTFPSAREVRLLGQLTRTLLTGDLQPRPPIEPYTTLDSRFTSLESAAMSVDCQSLTTHGWRRLISHISTG